MIGERLLLEVAGGMRLEAPHFVEPEIEAVLAKSVPFYATEIVRNLLLADVLKLSVKLRALGVIRRKAKAEGTEARSETD